MKNASLSALQKFGVMGMFDGLAGVLMILGGSHTSGTMQVLLSQGVIPCTLIASMVLLSKRFHLLQHAGAGLIVGGIILAKLHSSSDPAASAGSADMALFNLFFVLACVPSALSSVYKEVAFRGFDDLDVNVLQFWVAVFQTFMTFVTMPIYTLKILGASQIPMSEMGAQLVLGARCMFFFEDSVVDNCGGLGQKVCDSCSEAWFPVIVYFTFNCMFNIFTMLVIKHGSATLSFLVATLRMPLAAFAFSSRALMGADAVQPTISDFLCLIVIVSGLTAYRMGGRVLKRQLEEESSVAMSSPSTWLLSDSPSRPSPGGTIRRRATEMGWKFVPMFMAGINSQPVFLFAPEAMPQPRSTDRVRHDLLRKLGAASPLHSPQMRNMVVPTQVARSREVSPEARSSNLSPDNAEFEFSGLPSSKSDQSPLVSNGSPSPLKASPFTGRTP